MTDRSLHIVKRRTDDVAWSVIVEQSRVRLVDVVLVQDAVFAEAPASVSVLASRDDVAARGISTAYRQVGYEEIAAMVVDSTSVTVW